MIQVQSELTRSWSQLGQSFGEEFPSKKRANIFNNYNEIKRGATIMHFIEVTQQNLKLAYTIQKEIFSNSPDILHIKNSIDNNDPGYAYWIVYENETAIGISGIYTVEADRDSVWLSWYGVLPKWRSKGFGRKILLESIERATSLNQFKYLRLYTSEEYNASALGVYNSVMDLCERYENPDDETFERTALVYSYSLTEEKVTPWNNRYMGIRELEELCVAGELYLKDHGYEI
ncbi:GNAT family N-acetyltransferase [Clostridium sp. MSJ-4]|uniref:GNAT family N-acetyltransferase n=1 Tax=Clostridium simiarum TaxID=2841506 RepID=A0ABS6F0S1_9CLOT|nr:GNAT family N-acetyltransferase [Clostridium simiarum]MBU5591843.1 GNAT family N-acetyltransferase [Clostridium simiarum]